jgi:hypothetical protein
LQPQRKSRKFAALTVLRKRRFLFLKKGEKSLTFGVAAVIIATVKAGKQLLFARRLFFSDIF